MAWSARSSHSRKREPDPSLTGLLVFGESAFTRPRPRAVHRYSWTRQRVPPGSSKLHLCSAAYNAVKCYA